MMLAHAHNRDTVPLSLRCDFPQAFGIACVLPSYSFALILSDPARAALGR